MSTTTTQTEGTDQEDPLDKTQVNIELAFADIDKFQRNYGTEMRPIALEFRDNFWNIVKRLTEEGNTEKASLIIKKYHETKVTLLSTLIHPIIDDILEEEVFESEGIYLNIKSEEGATGPKESPIPTVIITVIYSSDDSTILHFDLEADLKISISDLLDDQAINIFKRNLASAIREKAEERINEKEELGEHEKPDQEDVLYEGGKIRQKAIVEKAVNTALSENLRQLNAIADALTATQKPVTSK